MNPAEDPNAVGTWILVCFALLSGVSTLLQIVGFFKPKPANHEVYATKEELREVKAETTRLHGRISGLKDDLIRTAADLTKSGDERAEKILKAVGDLNRAVREDLGGVHNRITAAEREITRVDERTKPRA